VAGTCGAYIEPKWRRAHRNSCVYPPTSWTRPGSASSGVVSKDAVTFSGQSQFSLGGSIENTFHGQASGTSLTGTTDMTSRGLFGTVTNGGPLTLTKCALCSY